MKKILSILLLFLALSMTFGAVGAEDAVGDVSENADVVAAPENVAVDSDNGGNFAAGGGENALVISDTPSANLMVDTEVLDEADGIIVWGVYVYNYGPDVAQNTVVYDMVSDNLIAFDYLASQGAFDYDYCFWEVGNLDAGHEALMYLYTAVLDYDSYSNEVLVISNTPDSDFSDNHDIAFFNYANDSVSAAEETLPETGNPLVVALMALMVVGVGGLRKLFQNNFHSA